MVVILLDEERQIALLMDIQEKVGRIDERLKRVEDTDRRATQAYDMAKDGQVRIGELERQVEEIQESRRGLKTTVWGAFISALVALLSVVATHIWG